MFEKIKGQNMKKTFIISILILAMGTLTIGAMESNTTESNTTTESNVTLENNASTENNMSTENNTSAENNMSTENNVTIEHNVTSAKKCGAGKCGDAKKPETDTKCGTGK